MHPDPQDVLRFRPALEQDNTRAKDLVKACTWMQDEPDADARMVAALRGGTVG